MVTGAYDPEISGGGVQCRELVRALRERIDFSVLTTATDPSLPASAAIDGIPVTRIFVDAASPWSKLLAGVRMVAAFWRLRGRFEVLHFHGFSQKTGFLAAWGLLFGKRLLLTLHTGGHDEPLVIRSRDPVGFWWYRRMHAFSAVSPRLHERYLAGGLLPSRCRMILNGIDTARFHPVEAQERCAIRQQLGLPQHELIVLFVGVFSPEKRPDVLFGAWARLPAELLARSRLVFVGATRSAYHEVDATLSERIREAARAQGLEERVSFTGPTQQVERYYQASDVYVLSSSREGLPLALLEAMASGLACVSSQLEGVTDVVVEDDRSGLLVPACDERALAQALHRVAGDGELRRRLGAQARQTVERRFSIRVAAERYLELYRALADGTDALGAALAREPKPTGDGSLILAQASNDESH